ncbi:hypothetical protein L211DRAFT_270163 [Terfezia boudieri ATCC MYA-4762]|uniref:Uncharacterized protein n=1 Tax=Terfezia boudieri ATCC MYA-4762 TaxID=1051890 RepID=A0A3N4LKK8_9PEZI|nr:hypothetical protein L211DRAFT_270163 [Terfezia boudieri ATCC MYA-4762]
MSVVLGLKDCRSDAVPVRREKEKKVRYRNVNAALIGTVREGVADRNQAVWTEKNKYKMNDVHGPRTTSKEIGQLLAKKASTLRRDWQTSEDYSLRSGKSRKGSKAKRVAMISSIHSEVDDDAIPGVAYSFDEYSGPSYGTDILATLVDQAEIKYENKVFDKLVKAEYEMVETTSEEDSDEEFELIDL